MAEFWSVCNVHAHQEPRAVANLVRQSFEAFFPFWVEKRGKYRKPTAVPAFPGYVFVKLNENTYWSPINSTFGVRRLMTYLEEGSDYRTPTGSMVSRRYARSASRKSQERC
jgi:hypothetical protein